MEDKLALTVQIASEYTRWLNSLGIFLHSHIVWKQVLVNRGLTKYNSVNLQMGNYAATEEKEMVDLCGLIWKDLQGTVSERSSFRRSVHVWYYVCKRERETKALCVCKPYENLFLGEPENEKLMWHGWDSCIPCNWFNFICPFTLNDSFSG